ncbi:MAG: hypothetical protein EOO72_01150, partial [Myxococcaceae bacterium]
TFLQAWNTVVDRVLAVARGYLGDSVEAKLNASEQLSDTARFNGKRLEVHRMGKWTLEHVVDVLCQGEPQEIAGPILVEATIAAAEYNLPTPHLDIEGSGAPAPVSLLES